MATRKPPVRETAADRRARDAHVNVLLVAGRFGDAMEQVCRSEGLTQAQYVVLWTLCLADGADGGIPTGAIADGLINRASDVTRLVDRMERAGLVERRPNPADRRGVLVRATPEGAAAFERVVPKMRQLHRSQWSGLSPAELETLGALLAKVVWSGGEDASGK